MTPLEWSTPGGGDNREVHWLRGIVESALWSFKRAQFERVTESLKEGVAN